LKTLSMSWVARVNNLRTVLFLSSSCLILGSCQTVYGWAESVGNHMPVIGERCNHWQCFTNETGKNETSGAQEMATEGEDGTTEDDDADETGNSTDASRPKTFTNERPPIIPPSTESGLPEVEQRGSRKPFPKPY
jgi:hypothetical protein